jgi:5-methylcytosine-specific restriction endonuclease McrA
MNQAFIQSLNDQDLIASTERVVEQERKIVQVVIWHLQEIQDRQLYVSMNYTSLYDCLIKHFKMSDTTAYGRIKVLKILADVPLVSESLKTGEATTQQITDRNSRYIPRSVKRFILKRAAEKCEHLHADGKRCSSYFQTQFDHVIAFSKGGKTTAENMQLLCRVHNSAKGSE